MRRVLASLMVAVLMGCVTPPPPPPEMSAEEREEFRQDMLSDVEKVETFLQKTRRGINLTEITLGWFVMILLNELSGHDAGLYAHIHNDDANAEQYLRTNFQTDPAAEIAALTEMAREGEFEIRMAAREALICLTTIPNPKGTAAEQSDARGELTIALLKLKRHLNQIAAAHLPARAELPGTGTSN
ncbi:hypothetical protein CCC_02652 [Paramagnetospirillum magnetotacticum MS-1]|uniref:Uncharacterized protein n=1 Tax=Paramagnetospirillum magnetotacticum MS-1 TaxID=272627 RepID=A0A0C2YXM2_PARME|nr:hypothetical protein [Paramagnetospirillum magnetotacticum]KIL99863.1 hypothetical protein CCC_02652 [Paramagnetospirillum magnetotacticum MS-1]